MAEVAGAIDRLAGRGEPVITVGHSFGSSIIAPAAGGSGGNRVASHLVYSTAVMQYPGRAAGSRGDRRDASFAEEEISIDPDTAVVAFYNRCKLGNVASATAHLRQIPVATLALDALKFRGEAIDTEHLRGLHRRPSPQPRDATQWPPAHARLSRSIATPFVPVLSRRTGQSAVDHELLRVSGDNVMLQADWTKSLPCLYC